MLHSLNTWQHKKTQLLIDETHPGTGGPEHDRSTDQKKFQPAISQKPASAQHGIIAANISEQGPKG